MLKRFKVWTYLAVAAAGSMFLWGCAGGWWPYNTNVTSWSRILAAYLREDLGS